MRTLFLATALLISPAIGQDKSGVTLTPQKTEVTGSFRGLAMRGANEAWATGSGGTVVRTTDGGKTWDKIEVPHAPIKDKDGKVVALDFRDVALLPDGSTILMSVGNGETSKLFRSAADGKDWKIVLENKDEKGFFDGISFDATGKHGFLFGDPLDGRLDVYSTNDSGQSWQRAPLENRPKLQDGEYCFAASGTGAVIIGSQIWIGTGGSVSRMHRSVDLGKTWTSDVVPLRSGNESSGIFSIAFANEKHGVAIGGDYLKPDEAAKNVAVTGDGGQSWFSPDGAMPHKACVCSLGKKRFLTCGRTGIAISRDNGRTWAVVSTQSYYACVFDPKSETGFMAGTDGRVAHFAIVQ